MVGRKVGRPGDRGGRLVSRLVDASGDEDCLFTCLRPAHEVKKERNAACYPDSLFLSMQY